MEVLRDDVQQALDAANTATTAVLAVLDEQGIAEQDRQTRDFAIYPDQRGGEDGRIELVGYRVRNLVEATVRDIDTVGAVLQAAAEAAGDDARIEGVRFALEDDDTQLAAAREAALTDARKKAQQYAELIGAELGEPIAVQETTLGNPRTAIEGAADMAAASVPIEPGAQNVVVQVTVRWTVRGNRHRRRQPGVRRPDGDGDGDGDGDRPRATRGPGPAGACPGAKFPPRADRGSTAARLQDPVLTPAGGQR